MDKNEAESLLNNSRKKIDEIDDKIIELILLRTSLSLDIATAKKYLNKEIFDSSREEIIHERIRNSLVNEDIDAERIIQIFDILASINKEKQSEIFVNDN